VHQCKTQKKERKEKEKGKERKKEKGKGKERQKLTTTKPTNDGVIRRQESDVIQIDAATIPIIEFNINEMQIQFRVW
jgi:hypothetical protein